MRMHEHATPRPARGGALARSTSRDHTIESDRRLAMPAEPGGLLGLQHLVGNAAVASLIGGATVQRDDKPGGKSIEIIFIIRKPNDQFTKDMTDYVKTTLKSQEYREVANIEDICSEATKLASQGITLSKVRIVGHGQTVQGGVGMTPAKEKEWRFVKPAEVRAYMATPECKGLRTAMAKDADVEFWGCYLGGLPEAGAAWADLFGAPVSSTKGEVKIGRDDFVVKGKGAAKSSKDVPPGVRKHFRKWLLGQYNVLRSTGEAPFLKTEDEQVAHMTDLFDRSGGKIRTRAFQEKGATRMRRPGEADELEIWETVRPTK
jgi:hypothetical protein